MKKIKSITEMTITGLIIFLFGGCIKQMSESVIDKNIGMNGGFEMTQNGIPVNWQLYTQKTTESGDFEISIDTKEFKEGKQSLKFSVLKCSSDGGRFSPGIAQEFSAQQGDKYNISFWVKNKGSEFLVSISGVNAMEGDSGLKYKSAETIDDWKKLEFEYTIPKDMNRLRFELNIIKPGAFWIDNLEIEKQ